MKNTKSILCVLCFVLLFMAAASAADAPPLTFTFTKANVPGAIATNPGGVNNAGVSVGLYTDKSSVSHGYILNGKKLTTLDDPKAKAGTTAGSNIQYNGTAVVGSYVNSSGASVGFLYKGGKFTDITGPAGGTAAAANAINDKGWIAGNYTDSAGVEHGFLLKGKTYTTLDVPGATASVATGVNNKGNVVLFGILSSGGLEASLYNGKTYKSINVPGAGPTGSEPLDINNENDVVFAWFDSKKTPLFHGALLHGGKYYKFDYPKAVQTYAGGLNDKSTLIGGYEAKSGGPFSGYKATFK
jgi:uncharacterized membrane protein